MFLLHFAFVTLIAVGLFVAIYRICKVIAASMTSDTDEDWERSAEIIRASGVGKSVPLIVSPDPATRVSLGIASTVTYGALLLAVPWHGLLGDAWWVILLPFVGPFLAAAGVRIPDVLGVVATITAGVPVILTALSMDEDVPDDFIGAVRYGAPVPAIICGFFAAFFGAIAVRTWLDERLRRKEGAADAP